MIVSLPLGQFKCDGQFTEKKDKNFRQKRYSDLSEKLNFQKSVSMMIFFYYFRVVDPWGDLKNKEL